MNENTIQISEAFRQSLRDRKARNVWTIDSRFWGKRCPAVYRDGSRCKGLSGHTEEHHA